MEVLQYGRNKNGEQEFMKSACNCRLSKDDGTDNESASIATQKSILTDYVKKAGMAHSKNVCGRWLFWYKFPKTKFPEHD